MEKASPAQSFGTPPEEESALSAAISTLPAPKGIGMAVAFDWGLAVQILVTPLIPLVLGSKHAVLTLFKFSPALNTVLSFLVALPFAALVAIFGEGARRGWRWVRPVQVVCNALLFLVGLVSLSNLWQSARHGNYWPAVTEVILLIFSPLIAWRMSRPVTKEWFTRVTSREARKRHGGAWPWLITIWAIVGGILQALAASH